MKLELAREEETSTAANDKCALVQKQLDSVSDKLLSLENKQSLDIVKYRENEEKAGLLEGVREQLAKALEDLETEKAHAGNFRQVAVSTEAMLKELQDNDKKGTENAKKDKETRETRIQELENELRNAQENILSVKGELEAAKEDTKQAAKEANTVQEQLETANSELKQRISILEDHKVSLGADLSSFKHLRNKVRPTTRRSRSSTGKRQHRCKS